MANVGTAPIGRPLISQGNGVSPTFKTIGSDSGLTAHGVVIAEGTSAFVATSPGTSGQVLVSNGAAADPSFQSGGTFFANTITGNTGGALSPTAGNWNIFATINPAGTTPLQTAGSGSTLSINLQRAQAAAATDATKVGVAVFNSAQFSVDANGFVSVIAGGFVWNDITSATQTISVENGYVTDRGGGVTYTLPATASFGDEFIITGKSGLWTLAQNANQQVAIGSASTTVGVGGSLAAANVGDSVWAVCTTAGASTVWRVFNLVGNITVT